jgi:NAD(P)-dependent dehydrogenase (short-subunit alcohol dehydrogenase family)
MLRYCAGVALLTGRVAIVTGGGRGIGREHCLELARLGARVVVVDPGVGVGGESTDEDPADQVVSEIAGLGGEAHAEKGSVADWSTCERIVADTVDRFGRLDAVVNNAGILRDRMITSMTEDDFDMVIAVHLKGTFQMTKHACDHWRSLAKAGKESGGRIINTTSGAGFGGNIGQASYAAAKGGIISLTLTTALEMARYDVTANAVSPVARTRMSADLSTFGSGIPEADGFDTLDPGLISPVVAYLASSHSDWLSGQVLRVEGNTLLRMEGWRKAERTYPSRSGKRLEAEELVTGIKLIYGTFPSGV